MSMHEPVPQITLHPNEIIVLESVVKGYLAFLRHGMPPSKKRDGQIRTLQRVQQHLIPLAHAQREQRYFPLTADEIQALDDALRSFVLLVRRLVPVSRERDETLRDVENLRQQLAGIISPPTS